MYALGRERTCPLPSITRPNRGALSLPARLRAYKIPSVLQAELGDHLGSRGPSSSSSSQGKAGPRLAGTGLPAIEPRHAGYVAGPDGRRTQLSTRLAESESHLGLIHCCHDSRMSRPNYNLSDLFSESRRAHLDRNVHPSLLRKLDVQQHQIRPPMAVKV